MKFKRLFKIAEEKIDNLRGIRDDRLIHYNLEQAFAENDHGIRNRFNF